MIVIQLYAFAMRSVAEILRIALDDKQDNFIIC